LERYAIGLLEFMTVQDVSEHLRMSWHTIKQIDKDYLRKHFSKPRLKDVEYIGIDEFAYQKGHKYNTIVVDLISGDVLYVGEGRSAQTLEPFWKRLHSSGAKAKAVAMDMWPAYIDAVTSNLKGVRIVYDHFHIVKNMNSSLDKIRRDLCRDEQDLNKRQVIKGKRWLLLKNAENLDKEKSHHQQLEEALKVNKPLAACYYLKEELRQLWSCSTVKAASDFITEWVKKAHATTVTEMKKFANSLLAHKSGILNYFLHPISTGKVEGINNKIKVLKRKAYGFRDMEYFHLKILSMNHIRYAFLR
jgi:transposase